MIGTLASSTTTQMIADKASQWDGTGLIRWPCLEVVVVPTSVHRDEPDGGQRLRDSVG